MKLRLLATAILATATFAAVAHAHDTSTPITEVNRNFLGLYEGVSAALAADDLAAAKKAATAIPTAAPQPAATLEAAKTIAAASSLKAAREAFKILSKRAVHVAENQAGFYHAHCPMVPNSEGDWVQTTKTINNPYFGKSMAKCGSIQD